MLISIFAVTLYVTALFVRQERPVSRKIQWMQSTIKTADSRWLI